MENNRKTLLPAAVLCFFAAAAIILALLASARLLACGDETEKLTAEIAALRQENRLLTARVENRLTFGQLEEYAVETLGMVHPSPEQIHYIG